MKHELMGMVINAKVIDKEDIESFDKIINEIEIERKELKKMIV
ncbi:hypothetical protein ERIN107935_09060 [Erysipelothrix inopinata]|nr:hypothetical protein [Erysipelothrix inopinata]